MILEADYYRSTFFVFRLDYQGYPLIKGLLYYKMVNWHNSVLFSIDGR